VEFVYGAVSNFLFLHELVLYPQIVNGGDALQLCKITANILNKQLQTIDKGEPTAWGLGVRITTPHYKKISLL
jgi:hypothetical protein